MNSPVPKQFLKLNGKPVVMHTISRFSDSEIRPDIILVLQKEQHEIWKQLCLEHNFTVPHQLAEAGETRYHSVKNGLNWVKEDGIVGVHDAVRPLVHAKTIVTAFKSAEMYGNAIPAVPLSDSIRQIDSTKSIAVDRTKYCTVQTPQCFQAAILKKAYTKDYKPTFTDDASVVESLGEKIHLVDGSPDNIKITSPMDLTIAEALLSFHPFEKGK